MNDKFVIITGANSGIGKAAALKFATEGYHVIMACRNIKISQNVQRDIIHITKNNNVDLIELDISSFQSIRKFCTEYISRYPKLDILIHNAAYLNHGEKKYQLSSDHIELSFATNVFGPFLMTQLLLDHLGNAEYPIILNACTTNIKHFFDPKRRIDFDNLRGEFQHSRPYNVYKMYGDSKMAFLILTFKMAHEFRNRGIRVNAIQINRVKIATETLRKMSPYWRILGRAQNVTSQHPSSMADHYFSICTSDQFKHVTGKLIDHHRQIVPPPPSHPTGTLTLLRNILGSGTYPAYARDPENIEKIWNLCNQLLKEKE